MDRVPIWVGLDYHTAGVQVCVMDQEGLVRLNRRCSNDWWAITELVEPLGQVQAVAMESCGGSAALADQLRSQTGWSVQLAHPGYVNRMRRGPDKSDWTDSKLLADLVRVGYLPTVWLAPPQVRQLRALLRYRQQLVDRRRTTKQRVGALLRNHRVKPPMQPRPRPWTVAWREWLVSAEGLGDHGRWVMDRHLEDLNELESKICRTEGRLHRTTTDDAVVKALRRQKGIGPVTSWVLRAEIGQFDRFASGKQLSRFCGLSPRNASSGERQADAGLVKAGNRLLRATLIEAAHRLKRHVPRWSKLAARLASNGKAGSVIAAAVANRWMRGLYYELQPERVMAAATSADQTVVK